MRDLSPARSMAKSLARSASPMSGMLQRRWRHHVAKQLMVARFEGLRSPAEALSPLKEGLDETDGEDSKMEGRWGQ